MMMMGILKHSAHVDTFWYWPKRCLNSKKKKKKKSAVCAGAIMKAILCHSRRRGIDSCIMLSSAKDANGEDAGRSCFSAFSQPTLRMAHWNDVSVMTSVRIKKREPRNRCQSSLWAVSALTWICEAWRSMVMMWSAPATDSMLATSLADMGARLWEQQDTVAQRQ